MGEGWIFDLFLSQEDASSYISYDSFSANIGIRSILDKRFLYEKYDLDLKKGKEKEPLSLLVSIT